MADETFLFKDFPLAGTTSDRDSASIHRQAFCHWKGEDIPKDKERARFLLEAAVAQGATKALVPLALLMAPPHGLASDWSRTRDLASDAASRDDADGMWLMGVIAKEGWGQAPDPEATKSWFNKAAELELEGCDVRTRRPAGGRWRDQ